MTHRAEILNAAKSLTCGDRDQTYGPPLENMTDIAAGWSVILGHKVEPHQVALCMAWTNTCRCKHSPQRLDNYTDGAAYHAIAGECADAG